MKFYSILFFICFLSANNFTFANEVKGNEFIATFLPNYHNNWNSEKSEEKYGDSVYIFIYAELKTQAVINYRNYTGSQFTDTIIIQANTIHTFKKRSYDFALRGYNLSGVISSRHNSERISNISFHLKTDNPVIVYGHSQAKTTSESFNILPYESLGKEHFVSSYNSSGWIESFGTNGSTPSQFAVVATADSTTIEINPSAPTKFNGSIQQKITLNEGEVYLVQATITQNLENLDLTGSYVKSDKPIALFGGHQRAAVPFDIFGSSPSRDYLVEQIPPLESWNLDVIAVPFPQPSSIQTKDLNDLVRIMAGFDNTEVTIDGVSAGTLNRGKFLELPLNEAMLIQATAPILVTAFKRTSQTSQSSSKGDPLMQIVPSIDQFGNNYKFIAIQAYEYNRFNYNAVYNEHYIALIVKKNSISSVVLDGQTLNQNIFSEIVGTDYYYGFRSVAVGIHDITATDNFGLFVCGYGEANSYGYFSGVITKRDDFAPPKLQSNTDCFKSMGTVIDQKISQVYPQSNTIDNIILTVEPFSPYPQEVSFSAELINANLDGFVRVVAKDSIGQQNYIDIDIPGFTIGLEQLNDFKINDILEIDDTVEVNYSKCFKYSIFNYGKFTQTLITTGFKNNTPEFITDLPNQLIMAPGGRFNFEICFQVDKSGTFSDSLFIQGDCGTKDLISISIFSSKDENEPKLTSKKDPCNSEIEIFFTDSLKTDKGIASVSIEDSRNIAITDLINTRRLVNLKASVIDPYQDSYLQIRVIDSAGYEVIYFDTIPGFTINLSGIRLRNIDTSYFELDFENKTIAIQYCDSVVIFNYGNFDINLTDVFMKYNKYFSLPIYQLPLLIKKGEAKPLIMCFKANIASDDFILDTLLIPFNCLNKEIALAGLADSIFVENSSRCQVNVIFEAGETSEDNFVSSMYPNPAESKIKQTIHINKASTIQGVIYSSNGEVVDKYNLSLSGAGNFEIDLNTSNLSSGLYFNSLKIDGRYFIESFYINK